MRPLYALAAVPLLLCVWNPTSASAFDLTGTWTGKTSCKGFADGKKFAAKTDVSAAVSQSGRDVNIEFSGLSFLARARGVAIPDGKKPDKGAVGFVSCGTIPEPVLGVTGSAKVTTTTGKTKGSIKFLTVVAGKDIGAIGITDGTFTCTGTLKRTLPTDPVVGDCNAM